ncbi:MAG: alpha/beta fold hydrolase [Hyphomicrobiaceae bacterium]|nr:alpha/beta fold hydrolase [Hyphomicrobiaceae bacterium]
MHVLEAGPGLQPEKCEAVFGRAASLANEPSPTTPVLLLLHGFPELAYSWRKIMPALAASGYHVIAPDQRGYGRTQGGDNTYTSDLAPFRVLNLVRDALGLVAAMGYRSVDAVIGHDFGAPVAAACAVARPDVFKSVALMSAPFAGVPAWPVAQNSAPIKLSAQPLSAMTGLADPGLDAAFAHLTPSRKHYQWFYSTPEANADMQNCPAGVHAFLRAYYHMKSADWTANKPHPLAAWTADAMAELPTYYVMNQSDGMAATVAPHLPSSSAVAANRWLPDHELAVYASEYTRNGFQGGLNWYRAVTGGLFASDLKTFAGTKITIPTCFIAGASDWGIYQKPGDFEAMQTTACTKFSGAHIIQGAGHWVQQEQPDAVISALSAFLAAHR